MTNVATINSQVRATIQAVFDAVPTPPIVFDRANYLMDCRTAGFSLPKELVDYTLFKDLLVNPDIVAKVIVPTIDDWVNIRDDFNHEFGPTAKFRVYDNQGSVIDAYIHGSSKHLKLAKQLKIDQNLKEIVVDTPITFYANGVLHETPRGFCFKIQAELSNFVVKQMMARYLGKVEMVRDIAYSIEHDRSAIPQLDRAAPRTELDVVVIYESRRFFDKVRRNKFYNWLATQAHAQTKIILIN